MKSENIAAGAVLAEAGLDQPSPKRRNNIVPAIEARGLLEKPTSEATLARSESGLFGPRQ
jgi:hypothetical protein